MFISQLRKPQTCTDIPYFTRAGLGKGTKFSLKSFAGDFCKLKHSLVNLLMQTLHINVIWPFSTGSISFGICLPFSTHLPLHPPYQAKHLFKVVLNLASGSVNLMKLVCKTVCNFLGEVMALKGIPCISPHPTPQKIKN